MRKLTDKLTEYCSAGANVTPFGHSHRLDVIRDNDILFLM
jgi:hypothetical protein